MPDRNPTVVDKNARQPVFLTDTSVSYWHRCFLLTPAFLTDTGVSYWHRRFLTDTSVSYWRWHFLLTPVLLTDTGVSYLPWRFFLTPAFLTDTYVSTWHRRFLLTLEFFILSLASYRNQSCLDRLRRQPPAAPKPVATPLWLSGQLTKPE